MKTFKNIFFDLGGVLFNIDLMGALRNFRDLGMPLPPDFLDGGAKTLAGLPKDAHPFFQMIHAMDVGRMHREEFLSVMHTQCRPDVTDEEIIDAYCSMINVPVSRLKLMKELRKRYKVYLLSNIGDIHWDFVLRTTRALGHPMDDCFDRCFCSFELGVAKPDPAIFQRVIEESGVVPEESLYIDDFDDNITAGRAAGLLAYKIEGNTLEQHVEHLFGTDAEN